MSNAATAEAVRQMAVVEHRKEDNMNSVATLSTKVQATHGRIRTTLLEVVNAVSESADSEREVVAVLHHLFASGQMRLVGEFTERDFVAALR